jgi:hypothetical protein
MRLSRKLRQRFYYSIPVAGAQVGWSRAESYRAAERGDIPTEKNGRFLLVPPKRWDRIAKRMLRRPNNKRRSRRNAEGDLTSRTPDQGPGQNF